LPVDGFSTCAGAVFLSGDRPVGSLGEEGRKGGAPCPPLFNHTPFDSETLCRDSQLVFMLP
jgi:hypothetical protein